MNEQDIFIRNLKNLMKERKVNQTELANRLDMTVAAINNIINQRTSLSSKFMFKICEEFNVTMAEMFTLDQKQFGIKEDVQDGNKDTIIQFQKSQIESLIDEVDALRREIDRYDFSQDIRDDQVKITTKNSKRVLSKNGVEFEIENVSINPSGFGWTVAATFAVDEIQIGR